MFVDNLLDEISHFAFIRELKQQRRWRLQKHEFAPLQTLSRLFHLVYFVKCWQMFLELNSKGQYQTSGKEKKVVVLCSRPRQDIIIQALSHCSRAMTAKKCTKKAWCTCKVVVLLIKPTALLLFSLPSTSSLLKLPIYLHTTPVSTVYQKLKLAVINGMLPIEYSMQRK